MTILKLCNRNSSLALGEITIFIERANRVRLAHGYVKLRQLSWGPGWHEAKQKTQQKTTETQTPKNHLQYCLRQPLQAAFAAGPCCHIWASLSWEPAACTACWSITCAHSLLGRPRFLGPSGNLSSKLPCLKTLCRKISESLRKAKLRIRSSCLNNNKLLNLFSCLSQDVFIWNSRKERVRYPHNLSNAANMKCIKLALFCSV